MTHDLSAEHLSYLRLIHLAPGLEYRRYPIYKSVIAKLGNLTNQNPTELHLTDKGLRLLEEKGLRVFGRPHNDTHELHLRDRLAGLQLLEVSR